MSDRLASLKHQRALVAEHLRWLDAEIAKEIAPSADSGRPGAVPEAPGSLVATKAAAVKTDQKSFVDPSEDPVLSQLQQEEQRRLQISKLGCWTVFGILLLGSALVAGIVITLRYP